MSERWTLRQAQAHQRKIGGKVPLALAKERYKVPRVNPYAPYKSGAEREFMEGDYSGDVQLFGLLYGALPGEWQTGYEPQRFSLHGVSYLPDFRIDIFEDHGGRVVNQILWIEIKGSLMYQKNPRDSVTKLKQLAVMRQGKGERFFLAEWYKPPREPRYWKFWEVIVKDDRPRLKRVVAKIPGGARGQKGER